MSELQSTPENQGNPNGMKSLAKYTQMPIERIQYYANADTALIKTIKRGVLFIMAFWSGGSVKGFAEITRIIHRLDPTATLEFIVIDTDGAHSFHHHPDFDGNLAGWGEVAWINEGEIQCTSGLGYNPNCFEPNTKALLEME